MDDDRPSSEDSRRPVRIVVVDDHAVLLDSLASSLGGRPSLAVVATMTSLAAFEEQAGEHAPFDVVVVDYDLSDGRGTELVEAARSFGAVVLLLSGGKEAIVAAAAARSGCSGFVHKGSPLRELVDAIHSVADGGTVFSRVALASLAARGGEEPGLTERELEVLRLLGAGRSARQISDQLYLSVNTTRTHIRSILAKFDAQSQLEAVVKAVQTGVIVIGAAEPGGAR